MLMKFIIKVCAIFALAWLTSSYASASNLAVQLDVMGAQILSQQPQALQLRYLQTLSNIAEENNSTIVFPIPMELLSVFKNRS